MSVKQLTILNNPEQAFPEPSAALQEPSGLLAVGGELTVPRMLSAYRQGIFPWFSAEDPILWWHPDPRAVLFVEEFHLSRSMQRFHRYSPFRATINQAFEQVIAGCAENRNEGTWITNEVKNVWQKLHDYGVGHSIEIWQEEKLVGGLYGMALGQLFCAESMFSLTPNASKTALFLLSRHFATHNGQLIDCQILNPHTASLGVREISRDAYLMLIQQLQSAPVPAECWQKRRIF